MRIGTILTGIVLALLVVIGFSSIYTIDQGEEGVVLTFGKVSGVVDAGLHFKIPIEQSVHRISIQQQSKPFEPMESYSGDQQPASITASINYHVAPGGDSAKVYSKYGSIDAMISRLVQPKLPTILKEVFGQYDAETVIKKRAQFNADVLSEVVRQINGPFVIDGVQVEDIAFQSDYMDAIAAKQKAVVEVQKRQQDLAQKKIEAQITVTAAQAEADSNLAKAKAQAEATRLAGEAEASAIRAKGDALKDNPNLVALTKAENWNGVLPTTVVPGSATPFLDVGR